MTYDKGAGGVKYIHSLTWDLDGCKNDCPKCAYEKGRSSRDGLRAALGKLAVLGNGDKPGNSKGNIIAQEALRADEERGN